MARSPQFLAKLILQLLIPAAVYLLAGLYSGSTSGAEYLLPNYLFMAAPQLLVSILAIWPRARRSALLWVLTLLNTLLVAFQIWVLLVAVPRNLDPFVWFGYILFAGATLLTCAVAWAIIWLVIRHGKHKRGARQSLGT